MLTEIFVAATQDSRPQSSHLSNTYKDVGIYVHELQPQLTIRHGFKKSSVSQNCLAVSDNHIFAAQSDKAVVNVYSRERGNQEATVPFPQKITSLLYNDGAAILVIGTQDGKLILWEVATGRISTSSAAHLHEVSHLQLSHDGQTILSASSDSSIHIWSLVDLVSFEAERSSFGEGQKLTSSIATFSGHRAGITALTSGHSELHTNFAVSTSEDKICHVWHIESCQILRTVLLSELPRSICLDPADRAFYICSEDGNVVSCNLYETGPPPSSLFNATKSTPKSLTRALNWKASTSNFGAALCCTLSYDGTTLLTGHTNGTIVRWDVGKQRMKSEAANLPQSVTNITMLRPDQLKMKKPSFAISNIVKPRLDLGNIDLQNASIPIPAEYNLQAQILRPHVSNEDHRSISDIEMAMSGNGIPQSLLDDAMQGIMKQRVIGRTLANGSTSTVSSRQVERLQDEVAGLKSELSALQKLEDERYARHVKRMERRDAIGLEKRKAFFAAQEAGRDGDAAMKPFAEMSRQVDMESDEEAIQNKAQGITSARI